MRSLVGMLVHRIAQRYLRALESNPTQIRADISEFVAEVIVPLTEASRMVNPTIFGGSLEDMLSEAMEKIDESLSEMADSARLVMERAISHLQAIPSQLRPFIREIRSMSYSGVSKIPDEAMNIARRLAMPLRGAEDWKKWGGVFAEAVALQQKLQMVSQEYINNPELRDVLRQLGDKTDNLLGLWYTLKRDFLRQDVEDRLPEAIDILYRVIPQFRGKDRAPVIAVKALIEKALVALT